MNLGIFAQEAGNGHGNQEPEGGRTNFAQHLQNTLLALTVKRIKSLNSFTPFSCNLSSYPDHYEIPALLRYPRAESDHSL
jgi:hypothetical protein